MNISSRVSTMPVTVTVMVAVWPVKLSLTVMTAVPGVLASIATLLLSNILAVTIPEGMMLSME